MKQHPEQMTLGRLIEELERCKPEWDCVFDFCGVEIGDLASYRGYYEDLAFAPIWPEDGGGTSTVSEVMSRATHALGNVFTGYKGGDFKMHKDTPIWVARHGDSGGTAVMGVINQDWRAVLKTAMID